MEEENVSKNHLTSAAAFVEGGIQEACEDACSICLEEFCESEPSSVTSCKHEFHLQCILEWCQRSSNCPMCWQPISLKDPTSQELLDAVEHERNMRMNPPRNTTVFHHPSLGDFELQHLPVSGSDSDLEERIIQHLTAAAAMGRARHLARREGQRNRASTQGRPQFLVFSNNPNAPLADSGGFSDARSDGNGTNSRFITGGEDSGQLIDLPEPARVDQVTANASGSSANQHGTSSSNRISPTQTSPSSQDRSGPSDLQSFSESLKSRFGALSTKYKESITKSTRGWRERLFNRNSSTAPNPSAEVHREVATVSQLMDNLEVTENNASNVVSNDSENVLTQKRNPSETEGSSSLNEDEAHDPHTASSTLHT